MDTISQIKSKLDIADVVGTYVALKKAGKNYKGLCPFHGEKTPSFMVSPDLQMYKCFGCNEAGDIFSFVQKVEGIDFVAAMELLAEKAGVTIEKKDYDKTAEKKKKLYFINENATKFYQLVLLKHPTGKLGLKYLTEKRKLTSETIKNWKIGVAPKEWDALTNFLIKKGFSEADLIEAGLSHRRKSGNGCIDKFRNRIMFPIMDISGKVLGFTARALEDEDPKYLNTNETLIFQKNANLYGLDKAKVEIKTKGAVLVEGSVDVITAHQAGLNNIVAPLGTALTDNQLEMLAHYTKDLTFCFDSDSAGVRAMYRAIEMAEKHGFNVRAAVIPSPYKDLDELVKEQKETAVQIINGPVEIYEFFVADNLKKFNRNSALGKKQIIDNLRELFTNMQSEVMLDHYLKRLAEELDIEEEKLKGIFMEKNPQMDQEPLENRNEPVEISKNTPEAYFLSLLLREKVDVIKAFLYNIEPSDFTNSDLQKIMEKLKSHVSKDIKHFDITSFIHELEDREAEIAKNLYLWEVDDKNEPEKELEIAQKRFHKEKIKKQMNLLVEQLKLAEMQNDVQLVKKLLLEVETAKKELL